MKEQVHVGGGCHGKMLSIMRLSEENETKVSREKKFVMKMTSNVQAAWISSMNDL